MAYGGICRDMYLEDVLLECLLSEIEPDLNVLRTLRQVEHEPGPLRLIFPASSPTPSDGNGCVKLKQSFSGTGYSEDICFFKAFTSRICFMEEAE